jgi:hypothetical protein
VKDPVALSGAGPSWWVPAMSYTDASATHQAWTDTAVDHLLVTL